MSKQTAEQLLLEQYKKFPTNEHREMLRYALTLADPQFFKEMYIQDYGVESYNDYDLQYQDAVEAYITDFISDDRDSLHLLEVALMDYFSGGSLPDDIEHEVLDEELEKIQKISQERRINVKTWAPLLADVLIKQHELTTIEGLTSEELEDIQQQERELGQEIKDLFPKLVTEIRRILDEKNIVPKPEAPSELKRQTKKHK